MMVLLFTLAWASGAGYGQARGALAVRYENELLTVQCASAPLDRVLETIQSKTGMVLLLEDSVRRKVLTADIRGVPLRPALQQLLEGSGVNYAMFVDRTNWQNVEKLYVGSGTQGGSGARRSASIADDDMPAADEAVDEEVAEPDDFSADVDFPVEQDSLDDSEGPPPDVANPDDGPPEGQDDSGMDGPPGDNDGGQGPPGDGYTPVQRFPRSSVTPGWSASPFGGAQTPPGALTFDAFGRPNPEESPGTPTQPPSTEKKTKPNPQD